MSNFLRSLKTYIRFSDEDSARLAGLFEHARPYFQGFADSFYDRITQHPEAESVLDGPAQVARLKMTLMKWMRSGLKGPHDQAYYERRTRIGHMHVVIGLPQQFMVTAMNVMRIEFHAMLAEVYADDPVHERETRNSVDKLLDLELAIMLRTYQDDSEDRLRRHVRLTTSGQVTARISQELKEPLDVIRAATTRIEARMGEIADEDAVDLRCIKAQADACEEIVADLSELQQDEPMYWRRVNVLGLMGRAQASVDLGASVKVEIACDAGLTMRADADLLEQAVRELMAFGLHTSGGMATTMRVNAHAVDAGHVAIDVSASGRHVLPDDDRAPVPRPYKFRLERAILEDIATRHHGSFQILEDPEGAILRLLLPQTPP